MASPAYVVRIPRSDEKDEHILVGVYKNGSKPLDLRLEATEGTAVYIVSLQHSHIASSRAKNGPCTEAEWEAIVASVLKDGQPIDGVEAAATVKEESSITITFRKRIESFGQRIGEFSLAYKEQELDMVDWCSVAIAARESLKSELAAATTKASELQATVSQLKAQLDDFESGRRGDALDTTECFQDVLNSKKAKVRELQRILATADVDPSKLASAGAGRDKAAGRAPGSSRASKRKAKQAVASDEESDDDAHERMDVDGRDPAVHSGDESTDGGDKTPTHSETEEEASEAEEESPPPLRTAPRSQKASESQDQPPSHNLRGKQAETARPPPPRDLPFGSSKPGPSKASAPAAANEGSETESDDEL